jgi:hypothetical protein
MQLQPSPQKLTNPVIDLSDVSMRSVTHCSLLLLLLGLIAGCGSVSITDTEYFLESPYILQRADGYFLRWRYGTAGASFEPKAKIVEGELEFSFFGSPKTGFRSGEFDEFPIKNVEQVEALKSGGAFWKQPDGSRVRLDVRNF